MQSQLQSQPTAAQLQQKAVDTIRAWYGLPHTTQLATTVLYHLWQAEQRLIELIGKDADFIQAHIDLQLIMVDIQYTSNLPEDMWLISREDGDFLRSLR